MALEDIGSLLIRVTVALLFLQGAWASSQDSKARQAVIAGTALVFKWRPDLFAYGGMVMAAAAAGLSVLLGIFPRLGALAMTIFLVPAAMIHLSKRREAVALKDKILADLPNSTGNTERNDVEQLTASTVLGHTTAALKNLSLIGPTLYLVLAGASPPMLIGIGPDCQWQGLLTQL